MSEEKSSRSKHAETIVRNHVIWSMGAGMIPVLVADIFAVSAIQLDMIRQMSKVYDNEFNEMQGKAIVTSLTSSALARITAGSVVKLIPGIGSWIGGVTVSLFAGASTYALGEVFKKHFESGGTILDFDPDRVRKLYKEKFEKGKNVVKEWKKEQKHKEVVVEPEVDSETPGFKVPGQTKEETPAASEEPLTTIKKKDVVSQLQGLAQLKKDGILSDEEFEIMKKKLLDNY